MSASAVVELGLLDPAPGLFQGVVSEFDDVEAINNLHGLRQDNAKAGPVSG